ncbi:hypothetical protein ACFL2A_06330 [Thermodesulfobacteriota bacterium]
MSRRNTIIILTVCFSILFTAAISNAWVVYGRDVTTKASTADENAKLDTKCFESGDCNLCQFCHSEYNDKDSVRSSKYDYKKHEQEYYPKLKVNVKEGDMFDLKNGLYAKREGNALLFTSKKGTVISRFPKGAILLKSKNIAERVLYVFDDSEINK